LTERRLSDDPGGDVGGFARPSPDGSGAFEIVYNDCIWSQKSATGGRSESLSVLLAHEMGHPWGFTYGPSWNSGMEYSIYDSQSWSYHYAGVFENMQRAAESSPSFVAEGTHAEREESQCVCMQCNLCE
jgi:hypothetical protein